MIGYFKNSPMIQISGCRDCLLCIARALVSISYLLISLLSHGIFPRSFHLIPSKVDYIDVDVARFQQSEMCSLSDIIDSEAKPRN
mmetsp:Transcript_21966/g.34595  ORF Transcript_21966/g.34595 Transcript_21966/m.34595 type:complete len:85 (+) Transcript_21966:208-462(+)